MMIQLVIMIKIIEIIATISIFPFIPHRYKHCFTFNEDLSKAFVSCSPSAGWSPLRGNGHASGCSSSPEQWMRKYSDLFRMDSFRLEISRRFLSVFFVIILQLRWASFECIVKAIQIFRYLWCIVDSMLPLLDAINSYIYIWSCYAIIFHLRIFW